MTFSGKWGKERRQLRIPGKLLTCPAAVGDDRGGPDWFSSGPHSTARAVQAGLKDLLHLPQKADW